MGDWGADIVLGVLELSAAPPSAEGAWLDGAERARLAAMSGPIRPREFLGGRFLVRSMAARLLEIEPSAVRIEVEAEGRPRIAAPEPLFLGLSHTRDYAACALSRSSVGLDIEELGRSGDLEGIEDYAFTPTERAFTAGPDWERRFFAIWTLKEAYLKRLGLGVPEILSAPSFSLGTDGALRAEGGEPCGYLCFGLGESIVGALAFGRDPAAPVGRGPLASFDPRFAPGSREAATVLFGDGGIAGAAEGRRPSRANASAR
jgi:phosphopantetheinyl transferase